MRGVPCPIAPGPIKGAGRGGGLLECGGSPLCKLILFALEFGFAESQGRTLTRQFRRLPLFVTERHEGTGDIAAPTFKSRYICAHIKLSGVICPSYAAVPTVQTQNTHILALRFRLAARLFVCIFFFHCFAGLGVMWVEGRFEHVDACVHVRVCMNVCACVYVCMSDFCACVYVCVCVCVCAVVRACVCEWMCVWVFVWIDLLALFRTGSDPGLPCRVFLLGALLSGLFLLLQLLLPFQRGLAVAGTHQVSVCVCAGACVGSCGCASCVYV